MDKVFLTLHGYFIEVMKDGGGNVYKIPHLSKDHLERFSMLPRSLNCDMDLYLSAFAIVEFRVVLHLVEEVVLVSI